MSDDPADPVVLTARPWPVVGAPLLLVPLGSTEQHGPHLPLDADTVVATAVAEELARRSIAGGVDAVVAPALAYGSSGEHEGFAGTVSIGREALELLLVEYGRSACRWASRLVIVNGHGGNVGVLGRAVPRLVAEGRPVAWLPCAPASRAAPGGAGRVSGFGGRAAPGGAGRVSGFGGRAAPGEAGRVSRPADPSPLDPIPDAHAGRIETSLLLHLAPHRVHLDRIEPGNPAPFVELYPDLVADGVAAVSPNGILGDPRGASAEEGARLFGSIVDAAADRLREGEPGPDGMLA